MIRTMSKQDWSIEELDYFVSLYRSHECLWNPTLSEQKEKDCAYADIQEKMLKERNYNLEIGEIKNKIFTLRALFLDSKKTNSCSPFGRSRWYTDMEYIMAIYQTKLFESNSGDSFETTIPMSTSIQTDCTNSPLKLSVCEKIRSEEVSMSDGEEELKLTVDGPEISTIKQSTRIKILEVLYQLYSDKVASDYLILLDAINQMANANSDLQAINLQRLMNIMKVLGFVQKELICGRKIIVENAYQRFERYTYFNKIKKARIVQDRQIVYIDERIIDTKLELEKVYSLRHNLPEDSTIYYHALTKDGLLNGIFSNRATVEEFTKWVSTILMSYLKSPSLVIMDRGPLHGVLEDTNPITGYSTKAEMVKWLIDNNVPFNGNMSRPILFELISKYRNVSKEYKIDKIFKCHGHKVLRLPCTFPDLNLSHLLWVTISEGIPMLKKSMPKITQQKVQHTIGDAVNLISNKKKKMQDMEKLLSMKEKEIYQIDIAIENMLENLKFV